MIIWSGLGILIPIVAILGIITGTVMTGILGHPAIGPGLGIGLAALGNWGLWKLVYPKQPKILIDPQTGQQVVMKPSHSLFFIPARAWTWILAILAAPVMLMGAVGERESAKEAAKPGYKEFTAANDLIDSSSKGPCHGNTEAAKTAAAGFSSVMKGMTETLFTGGSKKNLMTGGEFLTYCQDGKDTIVILCHVPSLRSYKSEEAKSALSDMAWGAGKAAANRLDPEHKKTLMVGLRGISSFGSIQKGATTDSAEPETLTDLHDKSVFYPAFLSSGNS